VATFRRWAYSHVSEVPGARLCFPISGADEETAVALHRSFTIRAQSWPEIADALPYCFLAAGHSQMESPFPKSTSAAGEGRIVARTLPNGMPGLEAISYQYPLKLISPTPTSDQRSVLVFLLSYGGGLVGGDSVNLSIQVVPKARLSIVTQGHTKIFKSASPDIVTRQTLHVQIGDDAALCLLPDPVQPFEGSVYEQTQIFKVARKGSLCLLDWVTQGRTARGENWSFTSWSGRNEVWAQAAEEESRERLLLRDKVWLTGGGGDVLLGKSLQETMHGLGVFGTIVLCGERLKSLGEFFLAEFAALPRLGARDFRTAEARQKENSNLSSQDLWRLIRIEREIQDGVLWSAANVRGCVVVKFGAPAVEAGRVWVGSMLAQEGSISEVFGSQALMCVR
jgi:urease accessory protein